MKHRARPAVRRVMRGLRMLLVSLSACTTVPVAPAASPEVLATDLDLLTGPRWTGSLTYLDYGTHQSVRIPCSLEVRRLSGDARWEERVGYDDEPSKDWSGELAIADGGRTLDGERVVSREVMANGTIRIVTETRGTDDDKPARIRHVYELAPTHTSLQKLVRFEGEQAFFERNRSEWSRPSPH